jgi:hypothetical protein
MPGYNLKPRKVSAGLENRYKIVNIEITEIKLLKILPIKTKLNNEN